MILEIDMGNSRMKWRMRLSATEFAHGFMDNRESLGAQLALQINDAGAMPVKRILVASVAGAHRNQALEAWAVQSFGVKPEFAVSEAGFRGVKNGYHLPQTLGVDRWLAILAGCQRVNGNCVIVDCGSAITVDLVDLQMNHLGGYIAPGFGLMRASLRLNTDAIGDVQEQDSSAKDPGRDTRSAVNSALDIMVAGLIQQAVLSMSELGNASPAILLTGGDAQHMARLFPSALVCPDLIFEGLGLVFSVS